VEPEYKDGPERKAIMYIVEGGPALKEGKNGIWGKQGRG
jgi:hypothetical protein